PSAKFRRLPWRKASMRRRARRVLRQSSPSWKSPAPAPIAKNSKNTAAKPATRIDAFQASKPFRRACAQPGRYRLDADAVPELGLQPDRGEAGVGGRTANAAGADPLYRCVAAVARDRLVSRREILRARWHAMGRRDCRRDFRHRIRADLSRPAADIGVARGGVSVYCAILCRARLVCLSRRTVAGAAMGWPGAEFRRRRAGDRGPP